MPIFRVKTCVRNPSGWRMAFVARDAGTSAARRRRERRLRSMLRHERLTVAMALVEMTHHLAPRRPTMARARGEESEMNNATGQLGDRVMDLLRKIDAPAHVEQVIAVPKISLDRVPQRSVCRRSRRAEQLVEVPTILSFSSLQQRTAEQTIDLPVPRGRGGRVGHGGVQGFSLGQGSTAFRGADHVDTPVPQGRGGVGGPQGFLSSSSGASSSHSPGAVDEAFTWFFSHFSPNTEKCTGWVRTRARNWVQTFIHGPLRIVSTQWCSRRTSWGWSRSRSRSRRRTSCLGSQMGFRPLRVCMRFLELHMGRPI